MPKLTQKIKMKRVLLQFIVDQMKSRKQVKLDLKKSIDDIYQSSKSNCKISRFNNNQKNKK